MKGQFVLFALMLSDEEPQWRAESSPIDAFVRANFDPMAEIPEDQHRTVRVLVRNGADVIRTGTDRKTGWPCFAEHVSPQFGLSLRGPRTSKQALYGLRAAASSAREPLRILRRP